MATIITDAMMITRFLRSKVITNSLGLLDI